jgi:hypothetical protein
VAAGSVVKRLASEYAGRPVVFLEYFANASVGDRQSRFDAAWGPNGYAVPMVMLSSGHSVTQGTQDFYTKYKAMIEAELPRPAVVELEAWQQQVGTVMRVWASLRNTAAFHLDAGNQATVWAIMWDQGTTGVTGMYVRAAKKVAVSPGIPPVGQAGFTFDLAMPTGIDPSKLRTIALAEYRPAGASGPFDMLQAVRPLSPSLTLSPSSLQLSLPQGTGMAEVRLAGPPGLEWSAVSHVPWLEVTPSQGPLATPARVRVLLAPLQEGAQQGSITFTATSPDGLSLAAELPVTVTLDDSATVRELPGVASLAGQNQTAWRSSLTLHNPVAEARPVLLEISARDTGAVVASRQLDLTAGEVRELADLYAELGAPSGAGCLRVTGDVLVWVRTFNLGEAGTFGQDVVSSREGEIGAGEEMLFPISTARNTASGFRSNLLLLNRESVPITVHLTVGAVSLDVPVPARTYVQLTNVGHELGLPAGTSVLRVRADGRWCGSVSTVDPTTGDPTTVRGQRPPE